MNYYILKEKTIAVSHRVINKSALKEFWNGFCFGCSDLEITETDTLTFTIGNAKTPTLDGNFTISVTNDGACIVAKNKKELIRGFLTLIDKIKLVYRDEKETICIPFFEYTEKPTLKNRMIHYCVFPDTKLYEIQKFIRLCAALKYTHIVIEFWGMLKFDCLKELAWRHAFSKEEIRPILAEARDLGLEVVPMFNHWGHATASRLGHGKHVVLDQNPRLQHLFSDDGWVWNFCEKRVKDLLKNIRQELMELFSTGEYFHIGCDEAYNFRLDEKSCHIVTDYLNELCADLKNQGRRPIIWGDMLVAKRESFCKENNYTASCPNIETERKLLKDLSHDFVIADWQYWVQKAPVETGLIFKAAGFDTLLCPWDEMASARSIDACCKTAEDYSLFGVMHTTWHTLTFGMPDVTKCGEYALGIKNEENSHRYYGPRTAELLRKVYPVKGDYEKSGWAPYEIGNITL